MKSTRMRRLTWILPLALYAIFFWRTPYSQKHLTLRVLDWAVPVVGLAAWCMARWWRRDPWPRTALDHPLLIWCVVTAVATLFSTNVRNSLQGTWEVWSGALILWVLVDAARRGWGRLLWRVLYLLGGVVCLIGVIEFLAWYFGWPLLSTFQQGWFAIGGLAHPFPPTLHRLGLALVNITALSAFVAMLIPPAICIFVTTRQQDIRWGMFLWLITAAGVEFLALSRGGFLALGVSLSLLLWGSTRSPGFRRWWSTSGTGRKRALLAGAIPLALVVVVGVGFLLVTRLSAHSSGDAVRLDLWRSAVTMLRDHPLAGVGPAAYGSALRLYRDPLLAREHITTAHNLYLNTGAEMGILGLAAGVWLLLTLAWAWWQRWRAETVGTPAWWRLLGIGTALAGLAAQSLVDTFVEPAIVLPASLFVAQILAPWPSHQARDGQRSRWIWASALGILAVGALGMAWDDLGYTPFAQSLTEARQGNAGKALSAAEHAQSHDPWMPLYTCHVAYLYGLQAAQGDSEAPSVALDRYQDCVESTPVPGWMDQMNMAALLWEAGRQTEARSVVKEATAQTPLEWMPWLNRGLWAEMDGEWDEAVEAYGWVLSLDPDLAGSPFWGQGRRVDWWDEIIAAGQQAQAERGLSSHFWQWQVQVAAGQWEAAVQEIEAWLDRHPGDTWAMAWLGEALLGLDRPEEAIVWLDQVFVKAPPNARIHTVRGETLLALGRYEEAEQALRTALFLEPDYRAHLGLARLAQRVGTQETALEEYRQALRPFVVLQGSDFVLYGRLGASAPLPQVTRIGYRHDGEVALEWGTLLEERSDTETGQSVYAAALMLDSFLDDVHGRMEGAGPP